MTLIRFSMGKSVQTAKTPIHTLTLAQKNVKAVQVQLATTSVNDFYKCRYSLENQYFDCNKISMAFRVNAYEADETNVNRIWEIEAERTNHMQKLVTIYRERETIRTKTEKDHLLRQKQLENYQKSKISTFNHRNKSIQQKINYQNALLRNRILEVYNKPNRKSHSVFLSDKDKVSPRKMTQAEQMYKTNMKIGAKISSMTSDIAPINNPENFEQHRKLMDMIRKKSPQKKAYLKTLVKKKFKSSFLLPDIDTTFDLAF